MAYAVTLLFNSELADVISDRWARLAEAGLSRSMLGLEYPPHVTLAVYDQQIGKIATAALDRIFESANEMAVTLASVETFGVGSGVCYVALASSPDLMQLHAMTISAIGEECRPHYRKGEWTPHCTLAMDLTDADLLHAKDILQEDWCPLSGMFETAALVEFVPVVRVKHWPLAAIRRSSRTP